MNPLYIPPTPQSPCIDFKPDGNLLIKGISTPDNIEKYYLPVFNWIDDFVKSKPSTLTLTLEIDYINTSSTRIMIHLFHKVRDSRELGIDAQIIWKYEDGDDDMLELGEDLKMISQCEIAFLTS
jgi:hypothetical protein